MREDPMLLTIWRDSVAAGDDADAPHEWHIEVSSTASLAEIVERIVSAHYLASIRTGKATWIIQGDRPLAVVAQQWTEPRFVVDPGLPIRELVNPSGRPHVEARYWLQVDPELVFECLRAGRPLPDRYNR